ncbi:MAG: MaoC family dehydratase [Bacteroidota bacterium]
MTDKQSTQPYKTHFNQLIEMKEAVGKEIGLTDWITIDQKRIDSFANTTEDHQWIHIDPEKSKQFSPYGTTIAHGLLVLSFAPKFTYEVYTVGDVVMGVNYGFNRVRFPNATKVNDQIRGRISLLDFKAIPRGAQFTLNLIIEIKGEEKPACAAEFIGQAYVG